MKKKSRFHFIKEKDGTTMIEVLVAFVVVVLMMATFSKIVTVSVNLLSKSRQTIEKTEAFDKNYYKTAERANRKTVSKSLSLSVSDKTSAKNHADKVTIALAYGALKLYSDSESGYQRYSVAVVEQTESPEGGSGSGSGDGSGGGGETEGGGSGSGDGSETDTKPVGPVTDQDVPVVPEEVPEDELAKAVAKYFAGDAEHSWTAVSVKDKDGKDVIVYTRADVKDGVSYVTVYNIKPNVDNQIIKDVAETAAGTSSYELLDLNKPKITNDQVDNLLHIFGMSEAYYNLQLFFSEEGQIMAIRYRDIKENRIKWSYYGNYTEDSVNDL
ncbi:MAG: hypothetical protein PHQ72_06665 [Hespellia sp.]|nr:hypothetical protein [Hespellia sp.]